MSFQQNFVLVQKQSLASRAIKIFCHDYQSRKKGYMNIVRLLSPTSMMTSKKKLVENKNPREKFLVVKKHF